MLQIVTDGGSRYGMTDDHGTCEWVNVSSGTGTPGLSWRVQRAVKRLCVAYLCATAVYCSGCCMNRNANNQT